MPSITRTRETSLYQTVVEKPLRAEAKKRIAHYLEEFAGTLTLEAKLFAFKSKVDIVSSSHVDDAYESMTRSNRSKSREFSLIFGSALLGAFLQGFVTEISYDELRVTWIVVYVVFGLIGVTGILWGLLSK